MSTASARIQLLGISAIVVISFILGSYRLGFQGAWSDEGYSLMEATGQSSIAPDTWAAETYLRSRLYVPDQIQDPNGIFRSSDLWRKNTPANVVAATSHFDNGNGAAYTLFLHAWINAFGLSNLSIRFPSVLFAMGTTIVVYLLVRLAMPASGLAVLAAGLTALSPLIIRASKMARAPSMGAFWSICSLYFLYRMLRDRDPRRSVLNAVAYGVVSALAFYAHYFAAYVFIGQALFMVGLSLKEGSGRFVYSRVLIALLVAAGISAPFLANGVWSGIQRGVVQEDVRVAGERERVASMSDSEPATILATPSNVAVQLRLLVANLFLVRSAAADTPWLQNRVIAAGLVLFTLSTIGIYGLGIWRGYRVTEPAERLFVWLCAAVVVSGLVYALILSTVVMKTIIPFGTRSHLATVPCASVLTALAVRGVLTWRPLWRYASISVLLVQALVFNAVTLRQVFMVRYAVPTLTTMTGNEQTALKIKDRYQPGDIVEYERWDDAVKVNLYLRDMDVMQRVDTTYLNRSQAENDSPRTIALRRKTGELIPLWSGIQDNGALLPSR